MKTSRRTGRGARTVTVRLLSRKSPPYFCYRAICCSCGTEVHSKGGPSLWCADCLKGEKK